MGLAENRVPILNPLVTHDHPVKIATTGRKSPFSDTPVIIGLLEHILP